MNKVNILIVEDDSLIALDLKGTLKRLGYTITDTVKKEIDVFKSIKMNIPDIILMDIDLNYEKSGIDLVKEIYKTKKIPVIYLSGVKDENLIDKALETKPAYYLTKPFNRLQLKSAIQLVISDHYKENKDYYYLGSGYTFDTNYKKLYHKGQIQKIGIKGVKFLDLLIEAKGEVVLFETIENIIWENQPISNDAIRLLVSRLRKKIDFDMIETVYSHGFKLKSSS